MNFLKIGENRFWVSSNKVELIRSMDFPLCIGEAVPIGGNKYDIGGEIVTGKKAAVARLFETWKQERAQHPNNTP